ncbi:hypothetical protein TRFO_04083 [Tritrichomonas foetus]|uniref:Protein kinase domain-containing protein n=1 Tax=Tritrichomonas foetus TaxID=1144522 RepID=A0A1J4KIR1_9EUKA|nr:hypothetical protein TRFO_04083 [Tritrichomonas foetus]|eukprot:OHT11123.1 hypothetical protein TRFO_04083 [Tritrichomonas foetus]
MSEKKGNDGMNEIREEFSSYIIKASDYRMIRQIGKGGYAEVWLAKNKKTGDEVAFKQLFTTLQPKQVMHFAREVKTMLSVNHPFFLKFIGFSPTPPLILVSEYIQNGSLFVFMRSESRRKRLTTTHRNLIAMGIAHAMASLHKLGIIHRDLKSLNILLDKSLLPRLGDFGIARFINEEETMTMRLGTPHWMAPETLIGESYGPEVDVYSYGMLLYELHTNNIPWEGKDAAAVIKAVAIDNERPEIPPDTPKPLFDLISACWEKDPKFRPTFSEIYELFATGKVQFEGTDPTAVTWLIDYIEEKLKKKKHKKSEKDTKNDQKNEKHKVEHKNHNKDELKENTKENKYIDKNIDKKEEKKDNAKGEKKESKETRRENKKKDKKHHYDDDYYSCDDEFENDEKYQKNHKKNSKKSSSKSKYDIDDEEEEEEERKKSRKNSIKNEKRKSSKEFRKKDYVFSTDSESDDSYHFEMPKRRKLKKEIIDTLNEEEDYDDVESDSYPKHHKHQSLPKNIKKLNKTAPIKNLKHSHNQNSSDYDQLNDDEIEEIDAQELKKVSRNRSSHNIQLKKLPESEKIKRRKTLMDLNNKNSSGDDSTPKRKTYHNKHINQKINYDEIDYDEMEEEFYENHHKSNKNSENLHHQSNKLRQRKYSLDPSSEIRRFSDKDGPKSYEKPKNQKDSDSFGFFEPNETEIRKKMKLPPAIPKRPNQKQFPSLDDSNSTELFLHESSNYKRKPIPKPQNMSSQSLNHALNKTFNHKNLQIGKKSNFDSLTFTEDYSNPIEYQQKLNKELSPKFNLSSSVADDSTSTINNFDYYSIPPPPKQINENSPLSNKNIPMKHQMSSILPTNKSQNVNHNKMNDRNDNSFDNSPSKCLNRAKSSPKLRGMQKHNFGGPYNNQQNQIYQNNRLNQQNNSIQISHIQKAPSNSSNISPSRAHFNESILQSLNNVKNPNFKSDLFQVVSLMGLTQQQAQSLFYVLSNHFTSHTEPKIMKFILNQISSLLYDSTSANIFVEMNLLYRLPFNSQFLADSCFDVVLALFQSVPSLLQHNFEQQMKQLISISPHKSLILLAHFSTKVSVLENPWPLLDLMIKESPIFLKKSCGRMLISILYYLCDNFQSFRQERLIDCILVFLSGIQSSFIHTIQDSYSALCKFYNITNPKGSMTNSPKYDLKNTTKNRQNNQPNNEQMINEIDFDTISLHLDEPRISNYALDFLLALNKIPIYENLIEPLLKLAKIEEKATYCLIKISRVHEGAMVILRNDSWISEPLPTYEKTLILFISILSFSELYKTINEKQIIILFSHICDEKDPVLLRSISIIIREMGVTYDFFQDLKSSKTLEKMINLSLEIDSEMSIRAALVILGVVGEIDYAGEYLLFAEKLKRILTTQSDNSIAAVSIISLLSKYPICAQKFKELNLKGYFTSLLKDENYREPAMFFLQNIEKYTQYF